MVPYSKMNLLLAIFPLCLEAVLAQDVYDYIVIGGGTAGLTIATRLSENKDNSVLVLEAGNDHINDTGVQAPGLFASLYGNHEYDWDYRNVPQPGLNNRVHANIAGKGLGGGSSVNFLFWTHAAQRDIDNWGALGNGNWSWEKVQPYLKKSESFVSPSHAQIADLELDYVNRSLHGTNGPIINSFPSTYGPLIEAWPKTFDGLGAGVDGDPRGGIALGGYNNLFNIDPKSNSRSYTATGYYLPALERTNFRVITGAFATKILFDKKESSVTAEGLTYLVNNSSNTAYARKEVILSAGSMQSSKLLELSGIGNCDLLKDHGIECLVDNPNVGENFQNHLMLPFGFAVNPGLTTTDDFANPDLLKAAEDEYLKTRSGPLSTVNGSSALLSLAQLGGSMANLSLSDVNSTNPGRAEQYKLLLDGLPTHSIAQEISIAGGISPQYYSDSSKVFASPNDGGHYLTIIGITQRPFSRGSVHIQSADPLTQARLDPRYLSHPLDVQLTKVMAFHIQDLVTHPPLSDLLQGNGTVLQPGYYKLTQENVEEYIREKMLIAYHHEGNCAMMPREKGGVVDERFRVYGTKGLRVVDASVFPMIPQGTITSLVVGVAERAAAFIREDEECGQ